MTDSPLTPTTLDLCGDRLTARYLITGDRDRAHAVTDQLVVEQTIEFPLDLVPDDDIRAHIVARAEALQEAREGVFELTVTYAVEVVGAQLPQLINVLYGNISMVPGVRLVDFELPETLLASFPGPRIGVDGLRKRFGRPAGPILATALKPMGTPIDKLAEMAYDLAVNGIHLVKDDHSFATQPFCMFRERVPVIADSIARANAAGGNSVYLPALNVPVNEIAAAVEFALEAGAGGLLVLPGLFGFDTLRWLAESTPAETIIMSHPSMLGSLVGDPSLGMTHAVALGKLPRLAGADVSIFPNYGGRFSFAPTDCRDVAAACLEPLGSLRRAFPAPAGGMTVERVPEMTDFYGQDVCLLIGGGLYRGDIATQVRRMVSAIED